MKLKNLNISLLLLLVVAGCQQMAQSLNEAESPRRPQTILHPWSNMQAASNDAKTVDLSNNLLARNYLIVLDGSGSMSGSECSGSDDKIVAAKRAIRKFATQIPAEDNLGLVAFDSSGITVRVPLGFNNRPDFNKQLDAVNSDSGTPLKSAITLAYQQLQAQGSRQLGYGEYHLVIVTDGEAEMGEDPGAIVNTMIADSPVVIHTIGFCIDENHSLNQKGRTYYVAADSPEQLSKGLSDVLAESEHF